MTCILAIILVLAFNATGCLAASHTIGRLSPVGEGKGVFPGRVVWTHSPEAVTAPEGAPDWFSARYIDAAACARMMDATMQELTGQPTAAEAWNTLFNLSNNGSHGYLDGETVAIKIDNANTSSHYNSPDINVTPQIVGALAASLVAAGVPSQAITIIEPGGYITDGIYEAVRAVAPDAVFIDCAGGNGRVKASYKGVRRTRFGASSGVPPRALEPTFDQASYLVNLAVMKGGVNGVALCGRNWVSAFEPVRTGREDPLGKDFSTRNDWCAAAELAKNPSLGGKCVLYLIDGLIASPAMKGKPSHRWHGEPFGKNNWPCTLLGSVDPVAIDMVGIDLLETQFNLPDLADNYLRQCAGAGLGVAEHWSSPGRRFYSRNLGRDRGIELVYVRFDP